MKSPVQSRSPRPPAPVQLETSTSLKPKSVSLPEVAKIRRMWTGISNNKKGRRRDLLTGSDTGVALSDEPVSEVLVGAGGPDGPGVWGPPVAHQTFPDAPPVQ